MESAIFNTATESFQVSKVIYAGNVTEIPKDRRKGESTHLFRILTSRGSAHCYFRSAESANNAKAVLISMMESLRLDIFRSNGNVLDVKRIVSFGKVYKLKNPEPGKSHAFPVRFDSSQEKSSQVWLTFKSEEGASNTRRALYASIQAANGLTAVSDKNEKETKDKSDTKEND